MRANDVYQRLKTASCEEEAKTCEEVSLFNELGGSLIDAVGWEVLSDAK